MRLIWIALSALCFSVVLGQTVQCQQQKDSSDSATIMVHSGPVYPLFQAKAPARDEPGLGAVHAALSAMHASNAASTIQDCIIIGTTQSESMPQRTKEFTWTLSGDEFRYEAASSERNSVFVSGHGRPASMINGKVTAINYHVARANVPYYLPGLVLSRELENPNFSVKYVGTVTINGHQVAQVHLSDESEKLASLITPQDWYFDLDSGMPLRVDFRIPTNENAAYLIKGSYEFSDFRTTGGMSILIPFRISFSRERLSPRTIIFSSVKLNVGVSASVFDAPSEVSQ